jgi:hypothetical protein
MKLSVRPETIIDIPTFVMPLPKKTGRKISFMTYLYNYILGFIVRNLPAFTILQSIFQQVCHKKQTEVI